MKTSGGIRSGELAGHGQGSNLDIQARRHGFFSWGGGREAMFSSQQLIRCRIPIQRSVLSVGIQQTAKLWPSDITAHRIL